VARERCVYRSSCTTECRKTWEGAAVKGNEQVWANDANELLTLLGVGVEGKRRSTS